MQILTYPRSLPFCHLQDFALERLPAFHFIVQLSISGDELRSPAEDALRSFTPVTDDVVGLEQKHGIVFCTLHQQSKTFVARSQCLLRFLSAANISQYLRGADRFACLISNQRKCNRDIDGLS